MVGETVRSTSTCFWYVSALAFTMCAPSHSTVALSVPSDCSVCCPRLAARRSLLSLSLYPTPFHSPFALSRSFPISHYDSLGRLTTIATRVSQVPQRKGKRKVETAPRGGNWQEREGERGIGCKEARKRVLLIYGHWSGSHGTFGMQIALVFPRREQGR